ncbi:oligosaccharide flippase family protein [Amycolatopsis anabasis]|uniref:oligosaccharide flippase family protein n=1 Tax=Amycolatopsis anabasis TaxID=1840409 RepID=UPI001FE7D8EA|nr:oligosaccharide flippase family protein [Amycolatopsis anabasis]
MSGLGVRAAKGTLWLGLVNLVSKGSQMAITLVLAAFLTEGELGLVTLAVALVNIGQVIQSMGVYDVVSRTERDVSAMAGTVLTLSVGTGAALAAVGVFAAEPIASALGVPAAAPLVRLAALSLPFSAAGGVQLGLLHRELDFRRRLLPDAGSAVAGAVVAIVLAATGAGAASLAIGLLCTAILQPVLGVVAGVRIRPCWDPGAAVEAARWIRVVGPAAVVATLLINVDYPIVARVLGPDAVGVYSLAYRIAWVPYIMVAIVLGAVAFPVYTRLIRDGRRAELPAAVGSFTRAALVVVGGLYVLAALLSDRVVVLDERWRPAAGVLVVLCGYGLGISLLQTWYEAIRAADRPRWYLVLEVAHLALLVTGLAVLTRHGVLAAAAAQAGAAWALVPVTAWVLVRSGVAPPARELGRVVVSVVVAAVVCSAVRFGLFGAPGSVTSAVFEAVLLLGCYAGVVLLTQRGLLGELRALRGEGAR